MIFVTNKNGWPSEYTRGYQIASALGCKVNEPPTNKDETIVCVKVYPNEDQLSRMPKFTNLYLDLIDSTDTVNIARRFPDYGIIAITNIMKQYLESQIDNRVVMIPEHTCNFEQVYRNNDKCVHRVEVVGYVGSPKCFDLDFNVVKKALSTIGLDFKVLLCETADDDTRKEIVDFYTSIDIQLCFRTIDNISRPQIYRNPLKVFNAGSFKIPTVAYPELSYKICAGTYFLEAIDLEDILTKCHMLKEDADLYNFYANRSYVWSKQFDISNVAKGYAKLAPNENFDIDGNIERMRRGR